MKGNYPMPETQNEDSTIGFGTARFCYQDKELNKSVLEKAIELGFIHIDTAETYGEGFSEEIVGTACKAKRDKLFLASKVWPTNCSAVNIPLSCERTLKKLNTEYLDLYYLHWPSPFPIEESIEAMLKLKRQGKIRNIGISNFNLANIKKVVSMLGESSLFAVQSYFSVHERSAEIEILPFCIENHIKYFAYSPSLRLPLINSTQTQRLEKISSQLNVTTHQLCLAYLLKKGVNPIVSTKNNFHLDENISSRRILLDDHHMKAMDDIFPINTRPGQIPIGASSHYTGQYSEVSSLLEPLHIGH